MELRKIPLEMFIQILQELYDGGADFVDISGETNDDSDALKDTVKLTVKPEYLSDYNEDDTVELQQEIEIDYSDTNESSLSDEDIDDLI
jgi:hypothetical protein